MRTPPTSPVTIEVDDARGIILNIRDWYGHDQEIMVSHETYRTLAEKTDVFAPPRQ